MNAMTIENLKMFSCTAAALAVTSLLSWTFVDSTSVLRWVAAGATTVALAAAVDEGNDSGRTGSIVLVD